MAQLSYCEELEALTKYNDPENADKKYNIYSSYCEKNLSK